MNLKSSEEPPRAKSSSRSRLGALAALLLLGAPGLAAELAAPAPALEFRDRHGALLRTMLSADDAFCLPVGLEDVSPWAVLATLAAEDGRFFSHHGVDPKAVARAAWQNARAGRAVSGGSTLTQQLVRAIEPRPRTMMGKAREALRALLLERRQDKAAILGAYLNRVSYGNLAQGIEAASLTYFGVPAKELTLAQAAYLAGVPKSPVRYDPVRRPKNALQRQRTVLERLLRWGWISEEDHAAARAEPIEPRAGGRRLGAPHFTDYIRRKTGLREARTTLDAGLQERLEDVLSAHLARLKSHDVSNGAVIALDNKTGEVLAWVGSADYLDVKTQGQVDGVLSRRQPGSALKPFAYGLALARGFKTSDLLEDLPDFTPGAFAPRNYDESYHGLVRLREALACSYNVPAVRLAEKVGAAAILATLRAFGLDSLDLGAEHYGTGIILGNGEVTLLELANAYATLARGGIWLPVKTLPEGEAPPPRRALDAQAAYLITHILSDNAARAAAFGLNSPLNLPFPFAAKTGTTKDYKDNWALGYTSDWTVGVWVGNFDGRPMRKSSGITGAAPILRDAALAMNERFGSRPFLAPAGIREVEVCPESGELPGPFCPERIREVFTAKNLPTRQCPVHGAPKTPDTIRISMEVPKAGDVFRLDPAAPRASQALLLKASGEAGGRTLLWRVDGQDAGAGAEAWWPLSPGRHRAELFVLEGKALKRSAAALFLVVR